MKNFLFGDANWLIEVPEEDSANIQEYLNGENNQLSSGKLKMPNIIGILPI